MPNNIDHLSHIIDHYAAAARDTPVRERMPAPIVQQRIPTHDQLSSEPEPLASVRARAAVIAREAQWDDAPARTDILRDDAERTDVVTRIAVGGAALLLVGAVVWGVNEVKQGVDNVTHRISDATTGQTTP